MVAPCTEATQQLAERTAEKDECGTEVDECRALHESTEDYGAKRSDREREQECGTVSAFVAWAVRADATRMAMSSSALRWTAGSPRNRASLVRSLASLGRADYVVS
jgi:hypothetical protein